jgi:glycosyltransferase involved in cell wall biosynthesis
MTAEPKQLDPRFASVAGVYDGMPPGDWPAVGSVPVSVLVPAKNEEANIVACLRHVLWAKQLVVVDSQSTDRTVSLAEATGAEVHQFHYSKEGWPKKKNWALESVPWQHEWVLIVDADEQITPELAREIANVVSRDAEAQPERSASRLTGYYLNRRFMFMGRWIKHCGYYPSWNLRLFKHRLGRYERIGSLGDTGSGDNEVHEHVVLSSGTAAYLKNDFLHYAYPDLATWVEKHNRYSTWEAHAMLAKDAGGVKASPFGGPIERRRWLKAQGRRLPFRSLLRFLYSYVLKGGFLDGYPGFCMCRLLAWYEFMSSAKHYEMTHREKS